MNGWQWQFRKYSDGMVTIFIQISSSRYFINLRFLHNPDMTIRRTFHFHRCYLFVIDVVVVAYYEWREFNGILFLFLFLLLCVCVWVVTNCKKYGFRPTFLRRIFLLFLNGIVRYLDFFIWCFQSLFMWT